MTKGNGIVEGTKIPAVVVISLSTGAVMVATDREGGDYGRARPPTAKGWFQWAPPRETAVTKLNGNALLLLNSSGLQGQWLANVSTLSGSCTFPENMAGK